MQALDDARHIAEQIKFALYAGHLEAERLEHHVRDLKAALDDVAEAIGDDPVFEMTAAGYEMLGQGPQRPRIKPLPQCSARFYGRFTVFDGGRQ